VLASKSNQISDRILDAAAAGAAAGPEGAATQMAKSKGSASKGSKQERTYAVLRERIVDGTYGPGYRLVIDAIARELEVSPMPVREAIRRLEAEGLVKYRANHGAQVAPLDERSWKEVMTTLAVLEGYATAAAAPNLDPADLEELRSINERMEEAIKGFDAMRASQYNRQFHERIYERCDNSYLRRELELTMERLNTLRSTVFIYIPSRGHASSAEHEALLTMIEEGADPVKIERDARRHKLRTVEAYEERLAEGEAQSLATTGSDGGQPG
jgi:DNA-binding GntR family transcriptional regulator